MHRGAKILIVEDEGIVATDLSNTITEFGYIVTDTVASADDAIVSIETEKPDLILMDIFIKGSMNGLILAKIVSDRYKIPVVHLTAYSDDLTQRNITNSGSLGYIKKPFDDQQIKEILNNVLSLNKGNFKDE